MKKLIVIALTLFLWLSLFYTQNVFSNEDNSYDWDIKKENILSKAYLNKTSKWKNYIKQVDIFVERNESNKELLTKISVRIEELLSSTNSSNQTTKNVLIYMWSKIDLILINWVEENNEDLIFEDFVNDVKKDEVEISTEESSINIEDKKLIENKIIKLQLQLFEKWVWFLENITKEFEKVSSYEEKWNFEMNIDVDQAQIWTLKWNLKLNNYNSKYSLFDSQFKSDIEASLESLLEWEDEIDFNLSWLVDYISKDWNMYMLLEKLNITDTKTNKEIKDFIDIVEKIAKENKYIKYWDDETEKAMQILKSFNPSLIISDTRNTLSKPLITAYKKEWNRYYLHPTKYACDKMKELTRVFDPFNPWVCTDKQYNELLNELSTSWTFYADILDNNKVKIGFLWNKMLWIKNNEWYIIFNNDMVLEINYKIDAWVNWWLLLDYKYASHFDFLLKWNNEFNIDFTSILNNKNECIKMNFELEEDSYYSKSEINIKLENKKIVGDFIIRSLSYDWNTKEKKEKNIITWKIWWNTHYNNKIANLDISYSWIEDWKEFINWSLDLSSTEINFKNKTEEDRVKSDILVSLKIDRNKELESGDVKINILSKEYLWYDRETYEANYSDEFKEVFDFDLNINNKKINGTTIVSNKGEETLNIKHSWSFDTDKLIFNNKFEFNEKVSEDFLRWYNYNNEDYVSSEKLEKITSNINLDIDLSNEKNNVYIFFNALYWNEEIVSAFLKNVWTKTFKDTIIKTPTNTVDYKELFPVPEYKY